EAWFEATHIDVQFDSNDAVQRGYGQLVRAYEAVRSCRAIWDVTSDRDVNKKVERSSASRGVDRKPVTLDYAKSDVIRFGGKAMRFANANGEDFLLYPGVIILQRADGEFALIDLREVDIKFDVTNFIEEETVPEDANIVGRTWAKVNRDGSPDRRFKGN